MTKCTRIATIVMGGVLCVLAAGCCEPSNRPAAQLSAEPATQPALDQEKEDGNSQAPKKVHVPQPFNIVYVVDRSGSMAPTFQEVQDEILRSIIKLQPQHDFTIIYFAGNDYIEGPHKHLVEANSENKLAAGKFLKEITPEGSSTVLPALNRAFQILKYADPRKTGRLIYLVSDGEFAGLSGGSRYTAANGKTLRGNQAVIQWLRENNPKEQEKGLVHINTFLFGNRDEEAKKVMQTIAKKNGGRFKLITTDE